MDPSRPRWLAPGTASASASARLPRQGAALPAVDERLVAPETGFEMVDGQALEASPSHEPHAVMNSRLAYVLGASVRTRSPVTGTHGDSVERPRRQGSRPHGSV